MTTISKILVPIDFSPGSSSAATYATALAQTHKSTITLFHVYEQADAMSAIVPGADKGADDEMDRARAHKRLEGLRDEESRQGAKVDTRLVVVQGSPAHEILRFSHDNGFDLIVMGTHGRRGLAHVLMGSIAETVVRGASCPVLTIHLPFARDSAWR